jgi:antitoxin component of RelBE/YafQ-DinJ toxin-antitoxin module
MAPPGFAGVTASDAVSALAVSVIVKGRVPLALVSPSDEVEAFPVVF